MNTHSTYVILFYALFEVILIVLQKGLDADTSMLGHEAAWKKAKVLHRDISPGNILIDDRDPKILSAFLNDWDLCKYKEDLKKGPSDKARSVRIDSLA